MFTYQHGWDAWVDPRYPVTGPAIDWSLIDHFVLHYTAANDLPDGDSDEAPADIPPYLRATQRWYLTDPTRGYSIAYNSAGDWLGGTWRLRGDTIKCAANRGWNHRTYAHLLLVDGQDGATDAMVASTNDLIWQAEQRAGRQLRIVSHSDIGITRCAGDGVRAQLVAGRFRAEPLQPPLPAPPAPPPPPINTPTEDEDMKLYRKNGKLAVWLAGNGRRCHVVSEAQLANLTAMLGPVVLLDESQPLASLGAVAGADPGDI